MSYDAQTEKYISENAEVEHVLLTPFRWLIKFIKFVLFAVAVILYLTWQNAGWVVGVGSHNKASRDSYVAELVEPLKAGSPIPFEHLAIDFTHRAKPFAWGTEVVPEHGTIANTSSDFFSAASVRTQVLAGEAKELPDYCRASLDASLFDTAPHSWSNRSQDSFNRKSARMYSAYVNGMVMVSALRNFLTAEKLHIAPVEGYNSCVADPMHVETYAAHSKYEHQTSEEFYNRWTQVSQAIVFTQAPQIEMHTENILASEVSNGKDSEQLGVTGICLVNECKPEDAIFETTYYDDLFAKVPHLTDGQTKAVDALNATATDAFWLQAAHENGVHDDAAVLAALARAQSLRDRVFNRTVGLN